MNVCTVIGARPQFIKAAVVSRALRKAGIDEMLVHTGQHYDSEMDRIFFDELEIPEPAVNLGVRSGSHGVQTAGMMVGLEAFLLSNPVPDAVVVYGDTNSTLAGAIVAAKLGLPLVHVEAGLRSFNRRMPEELNRIITDRLAQRLCCPTDTAIRHLRSEGITSGVVLTGDVMYEATRLYARRAREKYPLASLTTFDPGMYYVATIHRAENTDNPDRLARIFDGLGRLEAPVICPLHPRTRQRLDRIAIPASVRLLRPVGYLAMLSLIGGARKVLTDSGGLQKEAVWLNTPCVTFRAETEWGETLVNGWNALVGADGNAIVGAARRVPSGPAPTFGVIEGRTATEIIVSILRSLEVSV